MGTENQTLAIDAGNTSIKAALFRDNDLYEVQRFSIGKIDDLKRWFDENNQPNVVLSSVLSPDHTEQLKRIFTNVLHVQHTTKLPIKINYKSPDTLGIDRICNAIYSHKNSTTQRAVSIDIGTCIKFDLIDKEEGYSGGSIAPGINLRYQSLHDYTGNLPLLSNKSQASLVGKDTKGSIHSGVINGMKAEIEQMIGQYEDLFDDLTFFVTGGDMAFFDIHSKNDIFADENLTLRGLFEIYKHNA